MGFVLVSLGLIIMRYRGDDRIGWLCAMLCGLLGMALILGGYVNSQSENNNEGNQVFPHDPKIVPHKRFDNQYLMGYNNYNRRMAMANVFDTDKKIAVISALTEGSSIRSIERMTGVHRDTIMRLGVRIGQGCTTLMDQKMQNLPCTRLEMDKRDRRSEQPQASRYGFALGTSEIGC